MTASSFYASSDEKLKTEINQISSQTPEPSVFAFKWKDTSLKSYGFIAQELESQGLSSLVSVSEEDNMKHVDYNATLSLAVGKLQEKVRELEARIAILETKR